eukprot:GHVQ01003872.1.p1 GENE.GHVQ01003872.1~~GHVQ01003872.1.p1  ORF type:complete len:379 (+),score=78.84 GHVQ01003872.1:378-1514(+)
MWSGIVSPSSPAVFTPSQQGQILHLRQISAVDLKEPLLLKAKVLTPRTSSSSSSLPTHLRTFSSSDNKNFIVVCLAVVSPDITPSISLNLQFNSVVTFFVTYPKSVPIHKTKKRSLEGSSCVLPPGLHLCGILQDNHCCCEDPSCGLPTKALSDCHNSHHMQTNSHARDANTHHHHSDSCCESTQGDPASSCEQIVSNKPQLPSEKKSKRTQKAKNKTLSGASSSASVQDTKKKPSSSSSVPGTRFVLSGNVVCEVLSPRKGMTKTTPVGRGTCGTTPDAAVVTRGSRVSVRYVGSLAKTGKQFDKGMIQFVVGRGEVVKGMEIGVTGMREKDVRRIMIPSALGYGKRGCPPVIPGNADLVFEIETVKFNYDGGGGSR